jgi:hypothetical protein
MKAIEGVMPFSAAMDFHFMKPVQIVLLPIYGLGAVLIRERKVIGAKNKTNYLKYGQLSTYGTRLYSFV